MATKLADMTDMYVKATPAIVLFTAYTARTQGLAYALVPHMYLIMAYEWAQRVFPKNVGTLRRDIARATSAYKRRAADVQRHAEAVAALDGAEAELAELRSGFGSVLDKTTETNRAMSKFGLTYKLAYTYGLRPFLMLTGLAPMLLAIRRGESISDAQTMVTFRNLTAIITEMLVGTGLLLTIHATVL